MSRKTLEPFIQERELSSVTEQASRADGPPRALFGLFLKFYPVGRCSLRTFGALSKLCSSRRKERGMLYIFGGLPGTGKSTLAQRLARAQQAMHLRIDTIEQSLREAGCLINGPEGYVVAYRLAADNLRLGLRVVADSVNPLQVTRAAWREVAMHAGVPFIEIEVICSNAAEHRARVETRATDIAGLRLPTWDEVVRRAYEPWDAAHLVIDTAGQTVERSVAALQRALTRR